jgi:hypothetical protein
MGMTGGKAGGGGIIGAAISLAGSIFNPAQASIAPSAGSIAANNFIGPRAMGGPVTQGWAYQVREQGAGDEVFIPGTSGWIGKPKGEAGGGSTVIDMSTTIDARGATADAIAELKAEMQIRESRLRGMVPYMVDQRTRENRQRLRQ